MILLGPLLGLILGLAARGRLIRLIDVRLRWAALIFLALALRVGTQFAITNDIDTIETLRLPLYAAAFGALALGAWFNRDHPGMLAVAIGLASNGLAVVVNGGWMPVWQPALDAVGITLGDQHLSFYRPLPPGLDLQFFLSAGPLGDVIPLPFGALREVASVGDVLIGVGLSFFIFATLLRGREDPEGGVSLGPGRRMAIQTGLGLERPVMLGGGRGAGLSTPLPIGARVRGHPYIRLALNAPFASYWLAQTISLFGDRLHQVALGVLVYSITNSPLLTGLVFLAATLPNIMLGPIAGTFVDRWDHKKVLITSDVLRAGLVLLLPFAAMTEIALVYPMVFLITTVSLFFRPAKVAILPRIVESDDVMAATSATWTADTLADLAGFPVAGLFVGLLGANIGLAFFVDSATYVLSALLIAGISVAPLVRETGPKVAGAIRAFLAELAEGWRFLRGKPPLIQNTLISALAQMSVGVTLALTVVYARDALDGRLIRYPENYAAIETAIGVGNLVGGLVVGMLGARLKKGWLVVGGFVGMGLAIVILGLTNNIAVALAAAAVMGIANLVFIIPTQTIFIAITPIELMGRVVAFRGSLVFGSMTLAMAVSGLLAEVVPVGLVIALFGGLTCLGGIIGAFLPAVRDA